MPSEDASTIEIERKFLVEGDEWRGEGDEWRGEGDEWRGEGEAVPIVQGYLARTSKNVVRVRTYGGKGFLTVKGKQSGISGREYEYEIPLSHAEAMLALCEGGLIEKTRSRVAYEGHTWEIDVFSGANAGLIVAEIELESEDEQFARPTWLGAEVTADNRFKNACLSLEPYDATWVLPKR